MSTDETKWYALLDDLHLSPLKIAIVVAGGGSGAIGHCFRRQGASRTFVEAVIPYSRAAMTDYLGGKSIDSNASPSTAMHLSERAYQRAVGLCDTNEANIAHVGLSLVAALPTDPPRRGQDRIHVALQSHQSRWQWSLKLATNAFTRSFAETISDEMLFKALATLAQKHCNDSFFVDAGLTIETTP